MGTDSLSAGSLVGLEAPLVNGLVFTRRAASLAAGGGHHQTGGLVGLTSLLVIMASFANALIDGLILSLVWLIAMAASCHWQRATKVDRATHCCKQELVLANRLSTIKAACCWWDLTISSQLILVACHVIVRWQLIQDIESDTPFLLAAVSSTLAVLLVKRRVPRQGQWPSFP